MLISLGLIINYSLKYIGVSELQLDTWLELLGIVGLIMIVLEAALDLKLSREKLPMIIKSFVAALVGICIYMVLIALVMQMFIPSIDILTSMIYAMPLSIMSSAIVIPSVGSMCEKKKEFMVYESTFADILGIMIFYFLIGNVESSGFGEVSLVVIANIVITIVFSFVSTYLLLFLFQKIKSDIKLFVFLAVLIALYATGKMFHMSALLIILVFGMVLENRDIFLTGRLAKYYDQGAITEVFKDFKVLTIETAFIVRTFFFVVFGMSISLSTLFNLTVFEMSAIILAIIYIVRFVILKLIIREDINLQVAIAPRGLISILLFYNIPEEFKIGDFESGIILFVVLATCIIMATAMVKNKKKSRIC
jgi:NhaP-type Na+/H+ or K+/H+ antiporter